MKCWLITAIPLVCHLFPASSTPVTDRPRFPEDFKNSSIPANVTLSITTPQSAIAVSTTAASTATVRPGDRHYVPTPLQDRIATLECSLPPLPGDSRLWSGNETHELLLPLSVSQGNRLLLFGEVSPENVFVFVLLGDFFGVPDEILPRSLHGNL